LHASVVSSYEEGGSGLTMASSFRGGLTVGVYPHFCEGLQEIFFCFMLFSHSTSVMTFLRSLSL
jgi:hypothetical protein